MRPVIFLDMDGVLVLPGKGIRPLNRDCVDRLKGLLATVNGRVVITSGWGVKAIPVLDRAGVGPLLGITRVSGGSRGRDIDLWLKNHAIAFPADVVEHYVILDDDSDMESHLDRLVQTDMCLGLQDADVQKAIGLLEGALVR